MLLHLIIIGLQGLMIEPRCFNIRFSKLENSKNPFSMLRLFERR